MYDWCFLALVNWLAFLIVRFLGFITARKLEVTKEMVETLCVEMTNAFDLILTVFPSRVEKKNQKIF